MGPVNDELGLEQGGLNSSDMYKLYNNELLVSAQRSEQGVDLGGRLILPANGLVDDTALSTNSLSFLCNILLHLIPKQPSSRPVHREVIWYTCTNIWTG